MGIVTNAIAFKRAGATSNKLEIYTDATSGTVDTQITAVTSNGTFTAGTFSGIVCEYAIKYIGCTVSNTLNDNTTKINLGGTATDIWGTAPEPVPADAGDTIPIFDTITLANGVNSNVAIEHSWNQILGPTGAFSITGFAISGGNQSGFTFGLRNLTGQTMTLTHQATSTVGNRLYNLSGANEILAGNSVVEFTWDPALNSWLTKFSDTGTTGTGDFVGPASSTDNAVVRFDSTTGKLGQNSVVLIGDTGAVTGVTDLTASGVITGDSLAINDSDDSHQLGIATNSNLTADRTLRLITGDADRDLTFTGNATVGPIVDGEVPAGAVDGANVTYTLANTPNPATSLHVYLNGLRQKLTTHYTLAGLTITMTTAPVALDVLQVDYRY